MREHVDTAWIHALKSAARFANNHSHDAAIGLTFGYFTGHPVALLNRKRLKAILAAVAERSAELKRPLRVLDLACGGGIITCAVAQMGHLTLGLDSDAGEVRLAQLFAQEEKLSGMFSLANLLRSADWERTAEQTLGGKPDVIILAYALHHFSDTTALLKRLSHWVDPGALLLINEENPDSLLFRVKHQVRTWIQKDTDQEWHHTYDQWKKILETHSFAVHPVKVGLDIAPALARLRPKKCWSLVFTAQRV